MEQKRKKLSRKQGKALAALLAQPSVNKAAQAAGVGERTLWRWLQADDFKEAYRKARSQLVSHAIAHLQAGMGDAVRTLKEIIADKNASPSVRVSAAKAMIDFGLKGIEIEDLEFRVSELEKRITR